MSAAAPPPESGASAPGGDGLSAVAALLREQQAQHDAERRRLRRRVFWWRLAAILLVATAVIAALAGDDEASGDRIARVEIDGVITDDKKRDAMLDSIAEDDAVKALILRINSPGGTTVGGEALYRSVRAVSEKKPVVAVMGEVAASAAYMTAIACDRIIARGNSITASVGVIFAAPNFHRAIDSLGIEMIEIKSGAQKAEPSPFHPVDEAKLAAERDLVAESFEWFLGLVRERRGLNPQQIAVVRDGRILNGRMALDQRLIDEIGDENDAVNWLETEKGVEKDLPIVDRKPNESEPGLLARLVDNLFGGASVFSAASRLRPHPQLLSTTD